MRPMCNSRGNTSRSQTQKVLRGPVQGAPLRPISLDNAFVRRRYWTCLKLTPSSRKTSTQPWTCHSTYEERTFQHCMKNDHDFEIHHMLFVGGSDNDYVETSSKLFPSSQNLEIIFTGEESLNRTGKYFWVLCFSLSIL